MLDRIDIEISEVGLRDGLQSLRSILPTEAKKAWILAQAAAGVPEMEVGSFVPAKLLPQLADTAELVRFACTIPGLQVAALAPNLRGAEDALRAGVHKIGVPVSVSETHSVRNVRRTPDQMVEEVRCIAARIAEQPAGQRPVLEGGLSTAFGCTLEGRVSPRRVAELAEQLMAAGCTELGLADTSGYANPMQVKSLVREVRAAVGEDALRSLHLHNTRGQGLANVLAGLECGIRTLDSSLGGIGGCPFAPGASGNIVTEDLVFMLESMGLHTGINLQQLLEVRRQVATTLPNEEMYGFTAAAGLPLGWDSGEWRVTSH